MRKGEQMISIIIPTLNEERYAEALMKSLVPQLQGGDEIIIVDSFSKDATLKILRKYKCRIISMEKKGIAAAKNFGARNARNEIVAFLDADCTVNRHWIEKIKKHFKDRGLQAVAGLDLYHTNSKRKEFLYNSFSRSLYHSAKGFYKLGGKAWLPANNCAMKKKLFLSLGGYRNVVCEDAEFMKRWPQHAKVHYDASMVVWLSDRRFKKHGFGRTLALWLVADIKGWLGKGIHVKKYKKIN